VSRAPILASVEIERMHMNVDNLDCGSHDTKELSIGRDFKKTSSPESVCIDKCMTICVWRKNVLMADLPKVARRLWSFQEGAVEPDTSSIFVCRMSYVVYIPKMRDSIGCSVGAGFRE
jgi:hypothetical protein